MKLQLAVPTFGDEEINAILDVLRSKNVTQGARVEEFEHAFLDYLGAPPFRDGLMVNSGSSANLLAAKLIRELAVQRFEREPSSVRPMEVITPAVTWSTTPAPLIQNGLKPVFVDVGKDYQMRPAEVAAAVTEDTVAIAGVHLLGWPFDLTAVQGIAKRHNLLLWEDCCEALGAKWMGKSVGSWGDVSTFSFFFSHHLSAVPEGGLIVAPSSAYEVRAWREHGWTRRYPIGLKTRSMITDEFLDERYVFDQLGYNLRSTELAAAASLVQLKKQGKFQVARAKVCMQYLSAFGEFSDVLSLGVPAREGGSSNPFCFPVLIRDGVNLKRKDLLEHLASQGVESRPIMTGNITRHPWYKRNPSQYRVHGRLEQADRVHERGFLLPIHPFMTGEDVSLVHGVVRGFLKEKELI